LLLFEISPIMIRYYPYKNQFRNAGKIKVYEKISVK
jgi:hypothetical protein